MLHGESLKIANSVHPEYMARERDWILFRHVLQGGRDFVFRYVKRLSEHESDFEWQRRCELTPVPGFARGGVLKVTNAILQRLDAIRRHGGPDSYQRAVTGEAGGVDLHGSSMEHFFGQQILVELAFMGKVGIMTDSPQLPLRRTIAQRGDARPYIYPFVAEDIRNWEFFVQGDRLKLRRLLLRIRTDVFEDRFGFVEGMVEEFRAFWVDEEGRINVQSFDAENHPLDDGFILNLPEIPFTILELNQSLLNDIAQHQVLLVNFESTDANYGLRSNVPFYVEKFNRQAELAGMLNEEVEEDVDLDDEFDTTRGGDRPQTLKIGSADGRRFDKDLEYPRYIHPSDVPLRVSMDKQARLKEDIEALLALAIANAKPKFSSALSREFDERGLDAGLAAIGQVCELGERSVARHWASYERTDPATVKYPERWRLLSDEERRKNAAALETLEQAFTSVTARKELQKERAEILLGGKISDEALRDVMNQIDASPWPTADPNILRADAEMGFVSRVGASDARGYPKDEAGKAAEERAQREQVAAEAQRGEEARAEKAAAQDPDNNPDGIRRVRGPENGN